LIEANPITSKRVEVRAVDRRSAITTEMAPEVVTGDRDDQAGRDLLRVSYSVGPPGGARKLCIS